MTDIPFQPGCEIVHLMLIGKAENPRMKESGTILRRQFASDNNSGICPEAWAAMEQANRGHEPSYGEDAWTARAAESLRELFGADCEVFFVFNGTAANSLALASLCQSYHSIICSETAHIETDECGAPEFFSNGTKLLTIPQRFGKITPGDIERTVMKRSDIHYPKPRIVSISQATELGTVYSAGELGAIVEMARKHDLRVHMDGARFANAAASLNKPPGELVKGVDALCFGGTKNGLAIGEAVVFFDRGLAREFDLRCKQSGQLASKMRFLAAPWVGMLEDGAWLRHAANANRCARTLAKALGSIPGLEVLNPCEANSVFIRMPSHVSAGLRERGWRFYEFIGGGSRFMCSWDTTDEDIAALVSDVGEIINKGANQ